MLLSGWWNGSAADQVLLMQVLDFDFEKSCSVSLSNLNVYACLVCGKYYQGRGRNSHAYTHSLEAGHHVYINLRTEKVGFENFMDYWFYFHFYFNFLYDFFFIFLLSWRWICHCFLWSLCLCSYFCEIFCDVGFESLIDSYASLLPCHFIHRLLFYFS